ncbi:MAG: succinate dehydrogenase [Thalassobaculaceae bacterium]|nr:succinate dehydrogenase [Thalassobaculaceae bacterium]
MIFRSRNHLGVWAATAHRASGVLLAVFLPIHFLVLGLAIESAAALDGVLALAENPLVKLAEWGLVVLLTVHLACGARVMALEFLPWRDSRKGLIGLGALASLAVGVVFLFQVL